MKLTKSQKRLFIILGIVIAYAMFDFVSNREQYNKVYLSETNAKTSLIISPSIVKSSTIKAVPNKQHFAWKRDPFIRPGRKETVKRERIARPEVRLKLNAITYAADNSFVMINDIILMEGETIAGYRVEQIYKDKVKLTKQGASIYLHSK